MLINHITRKNKIGNKKLRFFRRRLTPLLVVFRNLHR